MGINGIATANFDYSLCSEGTRFCFVPVQSALDYGTLGNQPLNLDLEAVPIATKLATVASGVDVMIGFPRNWAGVANSNFYHTDFRNDPILNITGSSTSYHSCNAPSPGNPSVQRGFLNLEIGDEELYLENFTLPWIADYQAEWDVHVNDRNPHYEYLTQPNAGFPILNGIYSKENPFLINPTGMATFIYDRAMSPTGVGFNYNPPFSWIFQQLDEPLFVCCLNFMSKGINVSSNPETAKKKISESYLQIFPNPNSGNQVVLKYRFKEKGTIKIELINSAAAVLLDQQIKLGDATLPTTTGFDISRLNLGAGLYIIRLSNGKELKCAKLIIQR